MSEIEVVNHRLDALEKDVKVLYKKINEVTLTQVQTVTKLDSMLVTLVELKESIESIKKRPSWLWDKILVALISAICGVLISNMI